MHNNCNAVTLVASEQVADACNEEVLLCRWRHAAGWQVHPQDQSVVFEGPHLLKDLKGMVCFHTELATNKLYQIVLIKLCLVCCKCSVKHLESPRSRHPTSMSNSGGLCSQLRAHGHQTASCSCPGRLQPSPRLTKAMSRLDIKQAGVLQLTDQLASPLCAFPFHP